MSSARSSLAYALGIAVLSLLGASTGCGATTDIEAEGEPLRDAGADPGVDGGEGLQDGGGTDASSRPRPGRTCGNGVLDQGERCDGLEFGTASCASVSMGVHRYGMLVCAPDCLSVQVTDCNDPRSGAQCADGCGPEYGSCTPTFCPSQGAGQGCCQGPNGPCGVSFGGGACVAAPIDAGGGWKQGGP